MVEGGGGGGGAKPLSIEADAEARFLSPPQHHDIGSTAATRMRRSSAVSTPSPREAGEECGGDRAMRRALLTSRATQMQHLTSASPPTGRLPTPPSLTTIQ